MDIGSRYVIKFVHTLATIKSQFRELAYRTSLRSGVTRVLDSLESFMYQTHSAIEGYVDVELDNGKGVAWLLDIGWDDNQWIIESRVVLNDNVPRSTQETIKDFPTRTAETLDECIEQLLQATSELINSVDAIIATLIG